MNNIIILILPIGILSCSNKDQEKDEDVAMWEGTIKTEDIEQKLISS